MFDFYKNASGDYVEGYLSTQESFNGIVFLLKEPNDKNPEYFWFKNAIYGREIYKEIDTEKDKRRSKIAASKFRNRFEEMLESIGYCKEELYNAVYCNVHPEWGECKQSEDYRKLMGQKSIEMFEALSEKHQRLIVFTCMDIYSNIKNYYISKGILERDTEDGLQYTKRTLNRFKVETETGTITVYEMFHPSYGSRINKKKIDVVDK